MNKTSISSDTSPSPESGATDSPWQPSWWQWLIFALSGTLEIERQIAWLEKSNEELRKSDEEARQKHELRMSELRKETEQLRKENERLAVLESKIDGLFSKYNIKLPQGKMPEQP
jgi:RNase adaptor protein for sRNA GlmZ degradation